MESTSVGNKYVTAHVALKKNVLFFRNWIRNGIRKVSDVLFMNGILDENHINQKLVYKQNMYAEIMTMKDVLRPYQQHLIQIQQREINIRSLRKSKDFIGFIHKIYIMMLMN